MFLPELRSKLKDKFEGVPWGALGFYGYMDRIRVGMQQLLAGLRKFRLDLVDRRDLFTLTERASKATGIPLAEDSEAEEMEAILLDEVKRKDGRRHFLRVYVEEKGGQYYAHLTGEQGSGILSSMVKANGLAIIPEEWSHVAAGERVQVMML